ncbi:hypothetical protein MCB86_16800 [Pseudomonas sp. KSR10]|uniref:PA0613 family protein n=1 Tax=Pseudomonas sp. KSR10 TaxID=2916654 RepID=UPI001EF8771C|nr:hypothetical protein [Pseudomonas sp. KSR10]MCG6541734.1 hypothetical protein [Pseudomonas sp. KSR10]
MIKYIDEALQLWADELHGPEPIGHAGGGGNIIATLIDTKGTLIRSTRGSRVLIDQAAEIELIVNKYLPFEEHQVVVEHYCNRDSLQAQKWSACGCGRTVFYERLHRAHEMILNQLMKRAA